MHARNHPLHLRCEIFTFVHRKLCMMHCSTLARSWDPSSPAKGGMGGRREDRARLTLTLTCIAYAHSIYESIHMSLDPPPAQPRLTPGFLVFEAVKRRWRPLEW